jgi:hypothetical protein
LRVVLAKSFDGFTDGANRVLAQPKLFEDQVPQLDLHIDQNAGQTVVFMAVRGQPLPDLSHAPIKRPAPVARRFTHGIVRSANFRPWCG